MPRKPPREEARLQAQRRLGARIRQVRQEVGWNQREAAKVFGFASNGAVSNLEHGANGIDAIDLYKFARAANYPMEFFLDANYDPAKVNWPRNLMEWTLLAGGDRRKAEAHLALEKAIEPDPSVRLDAQGATIR